MHGEPETRIGQLDYLILREGDDPKRERLRAFFLGMVGPSLLAAAILVTTLDFSIIQLWRLVWITIFTSVGLVGVLQHFVLRHERKSNQARPSYQDVVERLDRELRGR
ncbi:MAG: hypothetical protein ACYTFG_00160 [Planctomycetota bacterium]